MASPGGPRIAGKYGLPLLSLTGNNHVNMQILADHWTIIEQRSQEYGVAVPSRRDWRIVGPMHIAETREQAEKEVEWGLKQWMKYYFRLPVEFFKLRDELGNEITDASDVDVIRGTGFGVIGTPEDAIAHIERMQEATGGFGRFMLLQHQWANRRDTAKSFDLFAQFVMPHFQDGVTRREERWEYDRVRLSEIQGDIIGGMQEAQQRHNKEYADKGLFTPTRTVDMTGV